MYLKGRREDIFCIQIGKNGIGTIAPIKSSAIVEYRLIKPFSSNVKMVRICINKHNEVISNDDNIIASINIIKFSNDIGSDK